MPNSLIVVQIYLSISYILQSINKNDTNGKNRIIIPTCDGEQGLSYVRCVDVKCLNPLCDAGSLFDSLFGTLGLLLLIHNVVANPVHAILSGK